MKKDKLKSTPMRFRFLPLKVCCCALTFFFSASVLCFPVAASDTKSHTIGVLTIGDIRAPAMDGFYKGMAKHGDPENVTYIYDIKDAAGDSTKLVQMAEELVAAQPDILIAAGGLEADTLRIATEKNKIPVVFLVVSSAVGRGLAKSMDHPGGNMTGIDINGTALTEKRLWYISKFFPNAHKVLSLNVPSIKPSVASIVIAREKAPQMGLEFRAIDVNSREDIERAAATISRENTDVILLTPCAPVLQALKQLLLPVSLQQQIPVFGFTGQDLRMGAIAAYSPSLYGIGRQASRLAIKILHGANPANLAIETPDDLELAINRTMIDQLGLQLPNRIWKLATTVVDVQP